MLTRVSSFDSPPTIAKSAPRFNSALATWAWNDPTRVVAPSRFPTLKILSLLAPLSFAITSPWSGSVLRFLLASWMSAPLSSSFTTAFRVLPAAIARCDESNIIPSKSAWAVVLSILTWSCSNNLKTISAAEVAPSSTTTWSYSPLSLYGW